jgi:hypothetical protein
MWHELRSNTKTSARNHSIIRANFILHLRLQLAMNTHHRVHEAGRFWLNVKECLGITLPPQDKRRLTRLRNAVRLGKPLPIQLFYSLEVLGSALDRVHSATGTPLRATSSTADITVRFDWLPLKLQLDFLSLFGGGNRHCIGSAFAQFEMKLVLAKILSRYQFALADRAPVKPVRRGFTLAPPNDMRMIMTNCS